jgi:putative DNA primase/helicase
MNFEVSPGKQPGAVRVQCGALALEAVPRGSRKYEADVTAYCDAAIAHRDCVDLARQDAREAFTATVQAKLDGAGDVAMIGRRLLAAGEYLRAASRRSAAAPELAVVDASDLDLPRVADCAWAALLAANEPPVLFRVGPMLVRLEQDEESLPALRPLTVDRLRFRLARVAAWRRGAGTEALPALPPEHIVRDMLARPDPPLPAVVRIVAAPVFAADGRLLREPGYDAAAETYYAPLSGLIVPAVPESPSAEDVARARALLCEDLLGDFPFTGEAERAHAVALALQPFVRELIEGRTPLHVIEKPTPGTGAGLLVRALTLPALGGPPAMMTEGRDEDEWRKRLTAKLLGAPAIIVIDNLRRRLDSAALSSAITAAVWEDRLLGKTEMVRTRVRCAWVALGNNPALSGEIARRTVRTRLDAKVDYPWLRTEFKHLDLIGWATTHRGELIWAALVLVRAWLAGGRPAGAAILGEFEPWARVMGGILALAGIKGFLENLKEVYETADAEGAETRRLLWAWWEKHQEAEVGVGELFALATGDDVGLDLSAKTDRGQRTQLGQRLAALRDRRYTLSAGDEPLVVLVLGAGKEHKVGRWRLLRAGTRGREKVHQGTPSTPDTPRSEPKQGDLGDVGGPFPGPSRAGDDVHGTGPAGGHRRSDAESILSLLTKAGVRVTASGSKLLIEADGTFPEALLVAARQHEGEILRLVMSSPTTDPDDPANDLEP